MQTLELPKMIQCWQYEAVMEEKYCVTISKMVG